MDYLVRRVFGINSTGDAGWERTCGLQNQDPKGVFSARFTSWGDVKVFVGDRVFSSTDRHKTFKKVALDKNLGDYL